MAEGMGVDRYRRIADGHALPTLAKWALEWGARRVTGCLRVLPDFVIIGAQRGGTTSLYNYLVAHPDVLPAFRKEVHYFTNHYERGPNWYRAHFPLARRMRGSSGDHGRRFVTGEASPYYLLHPHAARRAAETLPGARLIALLRNPVDRAYSHYHHEVAMGVETLHFEEAIAREDERTFGERPRLLEDEHYRSFAYQHFTYLSRGLYAEQLAAWASHFPRSQMLVLNSEDLDRDPAAVLLRVEAFLGIAPWRPLAFERHHRARYPEMAAETRGRLAAFYAPHNRRLSEWLGEEWSW